MEVVSIQPINQSSCAWPKMNKSKVKKKIHQRSLCATHENNSKGGKMIKFHEYKGPAKPIQSTMTQAKLIKKNAKATLNRSLSTSNVYSKTAGNLTEQGERLKQKDNKSSYDLLLHQQHLFLQWQMELKQQNVELNASSLIPNTMGADQSPSSSSTSGHLSAGPSPQSYQGSPSFSLQHDIDSVSSQPVSANSVKTPCCTCAEHTSLEPTSQQSDMSRSRLAEWRVSDLKVECRKRQLAVSGPKPNLLQRLQPYEDAIIAERACQSATATTTTSNANSAKEQAPVSNGQNLTKVTNLIQDGLHGVEEASWSMGDFNSDTSYMTAGIDLSSTFSFASQGSGGHITLATGQTTSYPLSTQQKQLHNNDHALMHFSDQTFSSHDIEEQKQRELHLHELLSATTLSIHEEMLRHQQRKIEQLQRELQRSQNQLKHQQHVILAARKAQAKSTSCEDGEGRSVADTWLAQLDTKHLQKFHIQLFLQHKMQQQNMQNTLNENQTLRGTHDKLQEDLHIEHAVEDIVRLIKQDGRTALLMVQLLRRFQTERALAANGSASSVSSADDEQKSPSNGSHAKQSAVSSKKRRMDSVPVQGDYNDQCCSTRASVDMEAIFRTVIEEAALALSSQNAPFNDNRLPGCDQLIPPHKTVDEEPFSVFSRSESHFESAKNESLDDIIDVLRTFSAQSELANDQSECNSINSYPYPNTYGSEQLTDLLGNDWLQDANHRHFLNSCATPAYHQNEDNPVTSITNPQIAFDQHSEDGPAPSELRYEENMDWLDLMLPSPSLPSYTVQSDVSGRNPLLAQPAP